MPQQVGASVSTVRRDLTLLEAGGTLRRTHGGARVVAPRTDEFAFSARDTHQLAEKEAIGRAVRRADSSRARQLSLMPARRPITWPAISKSKTLQIITNSLPVANHFASAQKVEVVVSGGVIYPRLGVLVGPLAVEAFSKIHADVAIMSAGGITLEGITNSHGLLIEIQTAMIHAAQRVIFCLDHTKFGRKSVSFLCALDAVDAVVTDDLAPAEAVQSLRECGVEVVVAARAGDAATAQPAALRS